MDKVKGRGAQAIAVDQIKCAALTCRHLLEDFLAKICKYEKDLSVQNQNGKIKTATRKVQYAFTRKKEADTLRSSLNIHIGTILSGPTLTSTELTVIPEAPKGLLSRERWRTDLFA